jgi:hypothetical protein
VTGNEYFKELLRTSSKTPTTPKDNKDAKTRSSVLGKTGKKGFDTKALLAEQHKVEMIGEEDGEVEAEKVEVNNEEKIAVNKEEDNTPPVNEEEQQEKE